MVCVKYRRFPILKNLGEAKIFIVLAITIWIAHFWHCASFGLYEDDSARIPEAMGITGAELWDYLLNLFLHFGETEGRPLHPGFIYLFSFLGGKLGGLNGIYWIGYIIVTVNSLLFYALLKRLYNQLNFAVIGALAFILFSADTTRILLTHSLGHQPSLMFLFFALHSYLSGRKKLSYLVILGSLLCYETVFPVFLAAPLLKKKWNSQLIRELFRHALVLGLMIVGVVIFRKLTGESRVNNLDIFSTITISIRHMFIGPIVSMGLFFYRPLEPLRALNRELMVFLPISFAGLLWVLSSLKSNSSSNVLSLTSPVEGRLFPQGTYDLFKPLVKLALTGLIMLILAYPFTLTVPVTVLGGQETRVHLAAVVGASILLACICSAILLMGRIYGKKRLATLGIAAFFSLLIGFGLIVQRDFKISWQYQKAFWTDVIRLCPDLTDGTVIFVEETSLKTRKYISANTWSLPIILSYIYQFPEQWKFSPRVYRLPLHWQKKIVSDENLFYLDAFENIWVAQSEHNRKFESSSVILLEAKNGQLTRRIKPLIIGDQEFRLKKKSASEILPFKKGILYDYLIVSSNEETIRYID